MQHELLLDSIILNKRCNNVLEIIIMMNMRRNSREMRAIAWQSEDEFDFQPRPNTKPPPPSSTLTIDSCILILSLLTRKLYRAER